LSEHTVKKPALPAGDIVEKLRIGILCPSEIAYRRFLPSLGKVSAFEYGGIAVADRREWFGGAHSEEVLREEKDKAEKFCESYGGEIFGGYRELLSDPEIDCVYIPLPPALHYQWGKEALEKGKHVLLEKPFTGSFGNTVELIRIAREKGLAVHENYMFRYHRQIEFILEEIRSNTVGEVRLYRIDFGFPFRGANDFRYNKPLGGGALLDCGGYTLKLASMLLGETARLVYSSLHYRDDFDVDIYGDAVMANERGVTAQIAFGMDNSYKCALEVWGTGGSIRTNRIFTAPDGYEPLVKIKTGNEESEKPIPADDCFRKSIERFYACVVNREEREDNYKDIVKQANLIEEFINGCNKNN
jgi:predicted dehydrogenase